MAQWSNLCAIEVIDPKSADPEECGDKEDAYSCDDGACSAACCLRDRTGANHKHDAHAEIADEHELSPSDLVYRVERDQTIGKLP